MTPGRLCGFSCQAELAGHREDTLYRFGFDHSRLAHAFRWFPPSKTMSLPLA